MVKGTGNASDECLPVGTVLLVSCIHTSFRWTSWLWEFKWRVRRWLSAGMLRHVDCHMHTEVSGVLAAFMIRSPIALMTEIASTSETSVNLTRSWRTYLASVCVGSVHPLLLLLLRSGETNCGLQQTLCPAPRWYVSEYGAAVEW